MSVTLNINGTRREYDGDPDTPLLWVIRDELGLTGTKYGCGIAQCGACTVHVDGQTMRSCSAPVSGVAGRQVTTIEGLTSPAAKAVQKAWGDLDVVQGGYWRRSPSQATATSTTRWRATSVAARPTSGSARPSTPRRRSSPAKGGRAP